jgi:polyphosphate kinase
MKRNLYNRIEVAIPIYDPEIKQQIRDIINIQLEDNRKARRLCADAENTFRDPDETQSSRRAQIDIYNYLEKQVSEGVRG